MFTSPASRIQANLAELFFQQKTSAGSAYLRFELTPQMTALIAMEGVEESIVIPRNSITPLPNMPATVLGIMSSRNQVFCLFDLAQLLGLSFRLIHPRRYQIIVLKTTNKEEPIYWGLAVNKLQGITRLTPEKIDSYTDDFAEEIRPYLLGSIQHLNTNIPLLNVKQIFSILNIDKSTSN